MMYNSQGMAQYNFDVFWDAFQHYLGTLYTPGSGTSRSSLNNNENAGEQSENGYWLLEENSNSDSNQEEDTGTSRWVQLRTLFDDDNRTNSTVSF